jgi:hypothetical protein
VAVHSYCRMLFRPAGCERIHGLRRFLIRILLMITVSALVLGLAGCTSSSASRADQGLVWGFVSAPKNAQLIADPQKSTVLSVNLSKVVAPEAAWVCVYNNDGGQVGDMVGQVRVERGTTKDVEIPLDSPKSDKVFVLMHADRGKPGVFEFDQLRKDESPDRPVFVGGSELVAPLTLKRYGVQAARGTARIAVFRQGSIGTTLTVGEIVAPANSWVVVQSMENGRPGTVIGVTPVPAGTVVDYPVALTSGPPRQDFAVTLFADAGVAGAFEFNPRSPISSADQPYYVDGAPVRSVVPVKGN